jgi:hypothetical protein
MINWPQKSLEGWNKSIKKIMQVWLVTVWPSESPCGIIVCVYPVGTSGIRKEIFARFESAGGSGRW